MSDSQNAGPTRTFTLDYWQDDGWYVGKLREVPGVFSQGESLDELLENIEEAYLLMVEEGKASIPVSHYHSKTVSLGR